MTTLAAPGIIRAHVDKLPTLAGWGAGAPGGAPAVRVFEGALLTREGMRRWCTVGYVQGDDGPAVHLEPVPDAQRQNREAGSIASNLIVAERDVAAARSAIFPLLASWATWLRADAVTAAGLLPGSQLLLVADVVLTTTRAGATASAVVTTSYQAITYAGEDTAP